MASMKLLNLGVNHHTAPIDIRESVAVAPEILQDSLIDLRKYLQGKNSNSSPEVAILSTCNRMEIYCAANDIEYADNDFEKRAFDWLAAQNNVQGNELRPYIYSATSADAVKHAFRVGSGLDSMVLGETQILGQMKKAIDCANQVGTVGAYLFPIRVIGFSSHISCFHTPILKPFVVNQTGMEVTQEAMDTFKRFYHF